MRCKYYSARISPSLPVIEEFTIHGILDETEGFPEAVTFSAMSKPLHCTAQLSPTGNLVKSVLPSRRSIACVL